MVSVLDPSVKVKNPRTLSRMADKSYEELMANLTAIIKMVKADLVSLGFTTDLWTSRALDSYISLTLSFIDRFSSEPFTIQFTITSGIGLCIGGRRTLDIFRKDIWGPTSASSLTP